MYDITTDKLLQGICDTSKPLNVDPDSREILKIHRLLSVFHKAVAEFDDAGERYDRISELLAPVYAEVENMMADQIRWIMNQ